MCYHHLIQEERYQISALKEAGWSMGSIGAKLGRPSSTISRELNRNRVVGSYQPQVAGLLATARSQRSAANARRVPTAAWDFAVEKLAQTWSPQQIAGHQRAEHLPQLSHETIYQRIYQDKRRRNAPPGATDSQATTQTAGRVRATRHHPQSGINRPAAGHR
jgi:IS30 family transposase